MKKFFVMIIVLLLSSFCQDTASESQETFPYNVIGIVILFLSFYVAILVWQLFNKKSYPCKNKNKEIM